MQPRLCVDERLAVHERRVDVLVGHAAGDLVGEDEPEPDRELAGEVGGSQREYVSEAAQHGSYDSR